MSLLLVGLALLVVPLLGPTQRWDQRTRQLAMALGAVALAAGAVLLVAGRG